MGARGNTEGFIMEPVPGMSGDPFAVSTVLCPGLRAIERASCAELASTSWLESILAPMPVLRAVGSNRNGVNESSNDFTGLYRAGIVHPPKHFAALLVHLAKAGLPPHGPLRTVMFLSLIHISEPTRPY